MGFDKKAIYSQTCNFKESHNLRVVQGRQWSLEEKEPVTLLHLWSAQTWNQAGSPWGLSWLLLESFNSWSPATELSPCVNTDTIRVSIWKGIFSSWWISMTSLRTQQMSVTIAKIILSGSFLEACSFTVIGCLCLRYSSILTTRLLPNLIQLCSYAGTAGPTHTNCHMNLKWDAQGGT